MSGSIRAAIVVGLLVGALAAHRAPAAEPTAAEIVAKNAAARGGLEAWRKVETMVWLGHISSAHTPMPSMRFKLEQKRPNKTRLQIIMLGEKSVRAFDGVHGWKARPSRGRTEVQPYAPGELKSAQAAHGIDGPLIDAAARGTTVTLEGVDQIGGRKAYHLSVRLANGRVEQVWVDAETWLEVRYDRMTDGPGGTQRRVSATYGDYRTVEGLRLPFRIETGAGPGATPDLMQLETVVLNAPLDDSTFGSPVAKHPRRRARPGLVPRAPAPVVPVAPARPPTTAAGELGGGAAQ